MTTRLNPNTTIRAVYFHLPPWTIVTRGNVSEGNGLKVGGLCPSIFFEITRSLGVRVELVLQEDRMTGIRLLNGTWIGMAGRLAKNEADLAINPMATAHSRLEVMAYTNGYLSNNLAMVGSSPPPTVTDIAGLVWVFDQEVWLMLFVTMVVLLLVSSVHVNRSADPVILGTIGRREFSKLAFSYLSAIFQEGTPRSPASWRARAFYGSWWLLVILLGNAFCGLFRSSMMAKKEGEKVRDLQHLATLLKRITPLVMQGGAYEMYFRLSTSEAGMKIWQAILDSKGRVPYSELYADATMRRMQKGEVVVIQDKFTNMKKVGDYCEKTDAGNIYMAKEVIFPHDFVFGVKKDMDPLLLKLINQRIRWLLESSLIPKWVNEMIRNYERCTSASSSSQESWQPLGMDDMRGIFKLIFGVFTLAGFVFISEVLHIILMSKLKLCRRNWF